ncbi:DinB family protein [Nakamurella deserti]|uniref:DinB family protein n=1 Tax=Nakamurella deserti TaxID=2164074 RepID=UPI000DBE3CA3|nr:DinB family protein [Nakamurella deserti]
MTDPTRRFPDMWLDPEDDPREAGAGPVSGEAAVLDSYLTRYRLTLELKCEGLTPDQLARRAVPPSTLSLLGLLRHLAKVEHTWAVRVVQGRPDAARPYWTPERQDLDFDGAVPDAAVVADAWATWRREVAHAREVYTGTPLDTVVEHHGEPLEVRDIVVHLIEEYARHCGHADLLRECIDGRTGQ